MTQKQGRILAIKWGLNPNSSSLGVDVTFMLFGATFLAALTPVVGAFLRMRKPGPLLEPAPLRSPDTDTPNEMT